MDEAHAHNIYVIFDIVLHHVGDVFAYPGFGSIAPWSDQSYPILWRDAQGNPNATWPEASSIPDLPLDAAVWPRELQGNRFFKRLSTHDDASNFFVTFLDNHDQNWRFFCRAFTF